MIPGMRSGPASHTRELVLLIHPHCEPVADKCPQAELAVLAEPQMTERLMLKS